jgi:transcriptional regulator with XRE-family HTH domain
MQIDYVLLGKRIAEKRRSLGLKQVEVNEQADLSDKYLSNIETARSIPSIDVLMRICSVLSVTPDYLLTGTLIKENMEMSDRIIDKTKLLSEKKLKLLDNFVDWLIETEIK